MSLQFNAALIKALHHSDKFSENYHLDINWQARRNFWNPGAFWIRFISVSRQNLRMDAEFLHLMGPGLHFRDHSINKLQSAVLLSVL